MARERLNQIMSAAAAGDPNAAFTLYDEYGGALRRVMRAHLEHLGAARVDHDDLTGLVMDACLELVRLAPGWKPGRAAPWRWAAHRLRALAVRYVGQWADALDDEVAAVLVAPEPAVASPDDDLDELELLRRVAGVNLDARLLLEALGRVAASPRNQMVLLAYRFQAGEGDPSPANTVAARFGMTPANVRQVVKRTTDRLRSLVASDPRFRPLADLALVA